MAIPLLDCPHGYTLIQMCINVVFIPPLSVLAMARLHCSQEDVSKRPHMTIDLAYDLSSLVLSGINPQ